MRKPISNIDDIKQLPVITNHLDVEWNKELFFQRYAIVSYYSVGTQKHLAYEYLSSQPCLSVAGLYARWSQECSGTRFFVLVNKGEERPVMEVLRQKEQLRVGVDDLSTYDGSICKRVVASLAINALGIKRKGQHVYSNGCLLLRDDKNFLVPESRKEMVCLKIEVNAYLNLTAKTTSFSNPKSIDDLWKHCDYVFQEAKDIEGPLWMGQAVKPVDVNKLKGQEIQLEKFFIQKKRFDDTRNLVQYWPYNTEKYTHGKLFAISQVVESVNKKFQGLLSIKFSNYQVLHYDEYKTKDQMLASMSEYMNERKLFIEDPFQNEFSKSVSKQFSSLAEELLGIRDLMVKKRVTGALVVKFCEPINDQKSNEHYTQSIRRLEYEGSALQHMIIDAQKPEDLTKAKVRRILLELMVKDILAARRMPVDLANLMKDWTFTRYKIQEGMVFGACMSLDEENLLNIRDYGFGSGLVDFESFAKEQFLLDNPDIIRGPQDYKVLSRRGNVYVIVDTDEVPILDANDIGETYGAIVNDGVKLSVFKRKAVGHRFLRGLIGMHLWNAGTIPGTQYETYSYLAGINRENFQITQGNKIDKVPRVRRIMPIHVEDVSTIQEDILKIVNMLMLGFGRWNEIMTFPFPFKFLQEHLDNLSESSMGMHWQEITYKVQ